jgi:hypothetical protein
MISIRFDERVLFVGKTRSGKTFLAERLTAKLPRMIVFDSLGRVNMPTSTGEQIQAFIEGESLRVKVETPEAFNQLVIETFDTGFYVVYVDELYGLYDHPAKIPKSLSMLWTRGGGNHIGTWAATQRPAWIPLFTMSETEHTFLFRLKLPQDSKRINELAGLDLPPVPKSDPHGFYYWSDHDDEILYVKEFKSDAA